MPLTVKKRPSTLSKRGEESPIGFGRSGVLVEKKPTFCAFGSPSADLERLEHAVAAAGQNRT